MEAELRDLYDRAPCGYHSLDADGLVVRINDTELEWLGYSREEVVGKMKASDLIVPAFHVQFWARFELLKQGGGVRDSEYEMRRKDGSTFPVLLSAVTLKDEKGKFLKTHASVFDLSEIKRARTQLEESELRNTAILQAAMDCIVSVDSNGTVIEFNPAAEKTFGYSRADALGLNIASLITLGTQHLRDDADRRDRAGDRAAVQAVDRPWIAAAGLELGERARVTGKRSDGERFPAEIAVTAVELASRTIFTAYVRDITREQWHEQRLEHYADELRAASRRLVAVQEAERRALASALHDLVGQNLTALSINLNIVKSESSNRIDARTAARLGDCLVVIEETMECIRDVMTELRPALLDDYGLAAVLRWYAEQFTRRTGVPTAVVESGETRRLAPPIEEAFFRIAQEALANVAKYARAGKATVTLASAADGLDLTIADDGCGFDVAQRKPTTAHHGWGLTLMRERAAAAGAQLTVESTPGHGTTVRVSARGAAQ